MKNNNKGFSLVELIVVIAIMAILAAVAVVGVSVYIPKAQQAADEQLASDIEYLLDLAVQSGELNAGDYVIIRYEANAVVGGTTADGANIDAVMKSAYGDNWQTELKLAYADWEIGVIANQEMMNHVENSAFNGNGLNNLMGQVQTVVSAAGNYLDGASISSDSPLYAYTQQAGVQLGEGNTISSENASAVANLAVFSTANVITSGNSADDDYYIAWISGGVAEDDAVANNAAQYSMVLAMATYLDKQTANSENPTSYVAALNVDDETLQSNPKAILTTMNSVYTDMTTNANVSTLVDAYMGVDENGEVVDKNAQGYTDAMAFLAYMQGVEDSSDNMLANNNIYSNNFFNDGTVLNYVQNYVSIGAILSENNVDGNAFAFIFDGNDIVCVPFDY